MEQVSNESYTEELNRLIQDLQSSDEVVRRYAVEDIEYGGFHEAAEQLVAGLSDESRAVAESCSSALIKLANETVVNELVKNLASEDVRLRNITNEILSQLGELSVAALETKLEDEDRDVRKFAVDALLEVNHKRCIPALVKALEDEDVNIAATAADAIGQMGTAEHVAELAPHLEKDSWMKAAVLRAMGNLGGEIALTEISKAIKDKDIVVEITAIQALGTLQDPKGVTVLLEQLATIPLQVFGTEMVQSFKQILEHNLDFDFSSLDVAPYLANLEELYNQVNESSQEMLIPLLGAFNEGVMPLLVKVCCDMDGTARQAAVDSIIKIGPKNLRLFEDVLDDNQMGLSEKSSALNVIVHSKHPDASIYLLKSLTSDDLELVLAGLSVANFLPEEEVIHQLKLLLLSEHSLIRGGVAEAMGNMVNETFTQSLVAQLRVEIEEEVKEKIDTALQHIGELTEDSMMSPYLESFSPDERVNALAYFGHADPKEHIETYRQGLEEENPEIRMLSFKVLANLKDLHLSQIETGMQDSVDYVRVEAVRCLLSIADKKAVRAFSAHRLLQVPEEHQRVKVELVHVLRQLGYADQDELIDLLAGLLNTESSWVKVEAVEALMLLDSPKVKEILKDLLPTEDLALSAVVQDALIELE